MGLLCCRGEDAGSGLPEEPDITEEFMTAFHGCNRLVSTFAFFMAIVPFTGAVWPEWRSRPADAVCAYIRRAAVALFLMLAAGVLNPRFRLEVHTNRMLREQRCVERLLVSRRGEGSRLLLRSGDLGVTGPSSFRRPQSQGMGTSSYEHAPPGLGRPP